MRAELLQMAADLTRRGEPFVMAVVVCRRPPSSAQVGDMAVVTADGGFHGWLGGSCTRPTVVREAARALAAGRPRLVGLAPDPEAERRPGVDVFPMTCHSGGSVEIYLEPVLPAPCLLIFGESPAARALAALGQALGYSVATDPQEARVPLFAVVATLGEEDEEAIRAAVALSPAYLGVVASAKRFAQMRETLLAQGVPAEALDAIRCPAGLKIGARAPEEIALSILAEIIEQRRAEKPAEVEEPAPLSARDPICGMTVEIATARHTAEHAGRTWYFCCGGCRSRFLAEPERYA
ncbi:MAG TPA: XdhC family protein [Thermoanaerobaculia bacterium]|nr:XdhC family protein [Thermoanaerobaculia bacterium]